MKFSTPPKITGYMKLLSSIENTYIITADFNASFRSLFLSLSHSLTHFQVLSLGKSII